jgi:putative transposase
LGVVDETMCLNDAGHMLAMPWKDIPVQFANVDIDAFGVMPNHVHGIIVLPDAVNGASTGLAPALGAVVAAFKSTTTRHQRTTGATTRVAPAVGANNYCRLS